MSRTMEMSNEEEERLLGDLDPEHVTPSSSNRTKWSSAYLILVHCFLLLALLGNVYQYTRAVAISRRLTNFPGLRNLRTVIQNEHPEHGVSNSAFDGPPSNATARAWRKILQPFYFNISSPELQSAGFSPNVSVKVKDGGFLASLAVYHELHCLNQFRNFLFARADPARFSEDDLEYWHGHLGHCIEVLRLSVMCSADLSLYTFTWPKHENFTFLDAHSRSPRKCVDWSQLEAWSLDRSISLTPTVIYPTREDKAKE